MKYTTHKLPLAELDPNSNTSGREFGEVGQALALERGETVETLKGEHNSSLNELEQALLSRADGVLDELDEPASDSNHDASLSENGLEGVKRDPNPATSKAGILDDMGSGTPAQRIDD